MSIQDALRLSGQKAREEALRELEKRQLDYHASLYSTTTTYDNAVILAGFAAFFALWSGTAQDIPSFARLVTVALMGVSLMAYIAVTIAQMLLRQFHLEWKQSRLFVPPVDLDGFEAANAKILEDYHRRQASLEPVALAGFWLSLFTGFLAACLLTYSALAVAFEWPVLVGL